MCRSACGVGVREGGLRAVVAPGFNPVNEAADAPEDGCASNAGAFTANGPKTVGIQATDQAGTQGNIATFTFVLANSSLPAGETIDKVYHDGVLVSTRPRDDPHVVGIKVQKFKGITTVVVRSSDSMPAW